MVPLERIDIKIIVAQYNCRYNFKDNSSFFCYCTFYLKNIKKNIYLDKNNKTYKQMNTSFPLTNIHSVRKVFLK